MCGIAGGVRVDGRRLSLTTLERMTDEIVHRGPDSFGYHLSGGAALGIRRLRVIDLVTGDQPISNEDRTIHTVLNGEIYNFQELRNTLERAGHRFTTLTDTETIVHAYEEYDDEFVTRLRGMFALALWDERRRRLVLARDRVGKKPLLYCASGGDLTFASEMRALLAGADVPREIDLGALGDYLAYGYVPAPATIFHSVSKLPPGHTLVWEDGRIRLERYWTLPFAPKTKISEPAALEELDARLEEAVRLRLISDVPVGALLSGGIDSSLVVAFMARHSQRVSTFSIGFDDAGYDELAHAKRVAEMYGTDHHEFTVRPDAAAVLPLLVRHYGEPYADSSAIPTFYVAQMARSCVTVALNGDGGDESFAGYERYRGMMAAGLLRQLPLVARGGPLVAGSVRRLPFVNGATAGRLERFLGSIRFDDRTRYASWVGPMKQQLWDEIVTPALAEQMRRERSHAVERTYDALAALGPLDRLLATDIGTYLVNDLLVKMDIASMANSLETRSPFLDHTLMEFCARLPERYKLGRLGERKYLLKRLAARYIPRENIERPKMGFGVPVGRWLRTDLRQLVEDTLLSERARRRGFVQTQAVERIWREHTSGTADRSFPLWTLLMLELWFVEFVDGHSAGRPSAAAVHA